MSSTLWFLLEFTALLAAAAVVFAWLGWTWGRRSHVTIVTTAPQTAPADDEAFFQQKLSELRDENTRLLGQTSAALTEHLARQQRLEAEIETLHAAANSAAPATDENRLLALQAEIEHLKAENATELQYAKNILTELETENAELKAQLASKTAPQPLEAAPAAPLPIFQFTPPPPPSATEHAKLSQLTTDLFPHLSTLDALIQERDDWQRRVTALENKTPKDPAGLALARRSLDGSQQRLDTAQQAAATLENQKRALQKALHQTAQLPPGAGDDLTKIKGIKTVLRDQLHAHGIRTWRQIADWDADDLRAFSEILSFKNRAVRDQWQQQAQKLSSPTE